MNLFILTQDQIPEHGVEIIGYNRDWVDEDFNPSGLCVCFFSDSGYWTIAMWNNDQDCWETVHDTEYYKDSPPNKDRIVYVDPIQPAPTAWCYKPQFQFE